MAAAEKRASAVIRFIVSFGEGFLFQPLHGIKRESSVIYCQNHVISLSSQCHQKIAYYISFMTEVAKTRPSEFLSWLCLTSVISTDKTPDFKKSRYADETRNLPFDVVNKILIAGNNSGGNKFIALAGRPAIIRDGLECTAHER